MAEEATALVLRMSRTPLDSIPRMDLATSLIVRESTEGLFSVRLSQTDAAKGEVCDVMRISRTGSERVCRAAFEQAMKRRKHCTLVDKVIKFL